MMDVKTHVHFKVMRFLIAVNRLTDSILFEVFELYFWINLGGNAVI